VTRWVPDILPGYWQRPIPLGPDPAGEGDLVSTLVRRGTPPAAQGDHAGHAGHAVLAVHGYTDYFFHTALADHFAGRGFAFYALDLHKCGRSRRDGQTPHFTTDLARYDAELDQACAVIAEETGGARILVYGHSAGGLIVSLWLDRSRRRGASARARVGALLLNSPFLDLPGPAVLRLPVTSALISSPTSAPKNNLTRGVWDVRPRDVSASDTRPLLDRNFAIMTFVRCWDRCCRLASQSRGLSPPSAPALS
jgi:alpha-beta hydrolase superfamily lysophospholipase